MMADSGRDKVTSDAERIAFLEYTVVRLVDAINKAVDTPQFRVLAALIREEEHERYEGRGLRAEE